MRAARSTRRAGRTAESRSPAAAAGTRAPGSLAATRRVIAVGAGFAGRAAADALADAAVGVTVLEARDRVGGRVHSRALPNGATVELGAEFVLPGHDVLRETVGRLGLAL